MISNIENNLSSIEVEENPPVNKSIIWLHGLGADGSDFVPLIPELQLPPSLGIRFIFPHAPVMPVTINNSYEMRAWFDIYALDINSKIDTQGINRSVTSIEQLISAEINRGIDTRHIIIAGFSQGATVALMTALQYEKPLGGVIALSGYLPMADTLFKNATDANRQLPIFLAHGTEDPIVPYALGKATYAALKQANYPISWHSYPMPHSVCGEEILAISQWIQKVLHEEN